MFGTKKTKKTNKKKENPFDFCTPNSLSIIGVKGSFQTINIFETLGHFGILVSSDTQLKLRFLSS